MRGDLEAISADLCRVRILTDASRVTIEGLKT